MRKQYFTQSYQVRTRISLGAELNKRLSGTASLEQLPNSLKFFASHNETYECVRPKTQNVRDFLCLCVVEVHEYVALF